MAKKGTKKLKKKKKFSLLGHIIYFWKALDEIYKNIYIMSRVGWHFFKPPLTKVIFLLKTCFSMLSPPTTHTTHTYYIYLDRSRWDESKNTPNHIPWPLSEKVMGKKPKKKSTFSLGQSQPWNIRSSSSACHSRDNWEYSK